MSDWLYIRNGKEFGPIPLARLQQSIAIGETAAGDLVWTEGMPDWLPINAVPELAQGPDAIDASIRLAGPIIPDAAIYNASDQLPTDDPGYQGLHAAAGEARANWKPPKLTRPYLLMAFFSIPVLGFGLLLLVAFFLDGQLSFVAIGIVIVSAMLTIAAFRKY